MADEKDWKAERVDSSSLIKVGGNNFASMNDVSQLRALQASAGALHKVYDRASTGGALQDDAVGRSAQIRYLQPEDTRLKSFGIGAKCLDVSKQRKGVIIHANAGRTKKTRTPVHTLADKRGRTWNAKQTDLDLIL